MPSLEHGNKQKLQRIQRNRSKERHSTRDFCPQSEDNATLELKRKTEPTEEELFHNQKMTGKAAQAENSRTSGVSRKKKRSSFFICRFFQSDPEEFRFLKFLFGLVFGAFLGLVFYVGMVERMTFPAEEMRYQFGGAVAMLMSLGYALSVQVRCTLILVIPLFFGKHGRRIINAYAITFLMTGPMANMMSNAKESSRSISCSSDLAYQQSLTVMKFMAAPMMDVMKDLRSQAQDLDRSSSDVKRKFIPVEKEVEQADEGKTINQNQNSERKYKKKVGNRCEDLKKKAVAECEKQMGIAYDECQVINRGFVQTLRKIFTGDPCRHIPKKECERLGDPCGLSNYRHVPKTDCPGYDISDAREGVTLKACARACCEQKARCQSFQYNIWKACFLKTRRCTDRRKKKHDGGNMYDRLPGRIPDHMCQPADDNVDSGFGKSYDSSDASVKELDKHFDVEMEYQIISRPKNLNLKTAEDVGLAIDQEFRQRMAVFRFLSSAINKIFAFLFVLTILAAHTYQRKFCTKFDFDNLYITGYFRWIDARRRRAGKRTLLPLKKAEENEIIYPTRMKLMSHEKAKLTKGIILVLGQTVFALVVFFLDYLLFESLDIIRRHSLVTTTMKGHHLLDVKVLGDGAMANVIKTMFNSMENQKHTLDHVSTNKHCLPHPTELESWYLWVVLGIYVAQVGLYYIEAYALRLRRVIASFFYRRRAKKRTLHLYNEFMRKRVGFLTHMRKKIRRLVREKKLSVETALPTILRYRFPCLFGWLKWFGLGKKQCLICDDNENKFTHHCTGCMYVYCRQCWRDMKKTCYNCDPVYTSEDTQTSDTSSSSEED
ncbi:E3 ubiquitin-protein ligase DCST1-like isoform X2 [Branchiostoma floridae x Branchiostoma japonicum]